MPGDRDLAGTICKCLPDTRQNAIKAAAEVCTATNESALISEADLYLVVDALNVHLTVCNFCRQSTANLLVLTLSYILTLLRIRACVLS